MLNQINELKKLNKLRQTNRSISSVSPLPPSIIRPIIIGDKADEKTLNAHNNDLISPSHFVPYLSASNEFIIGWSMPPANPKKMKNRASVNFSFPSHKRKHANNIGNCVKDAILWAENLSTNIPEKKAPLMEATAYQM